MAKRKTKKRKKKNCSVVSHPWQTTGLGGRDVFIKRLENLADIAGCKDSCSMLSKKFRSFIYITRVHLTQPKVDKDEPIGKSLAKFLANLLRNQRNIRNIELIKGKEKISIEDMFVISVFSNNVCCQEKNLESKPLSIAFEPLFKAFDELDHPDVMLYNMYNNILAMMNELGCRMFSIETDVVEKDYPVYGLFHIVKVKHHRLIKQNIVINGKRRPIIKFGWPEVNEGIWYFKIKADKIKSIYKGEKKELDVYIQYHAIKRFEERTQPLPLAVCRLFIAKMFRNYKIVEIKDGKIFLPLYYGNSKMGYFVADIIDEKIVIKTFLFITHHSTPEGRLLEKLTGLGKTDISYWHFDSLTSFLTNLPEEGSLIRKVMEEVGIDKLFQVKDLLIEESDPKLNYVDWTEVEDYIEKGREERLLIPEDYYEEEQC